MNGDHLTQPARRHKLNEPNSLRWEKHFTKENQISVSTKEESPSHYGS